MLNICYQNNKTKLHKKLYCKSICKNLRILLMSLSSQKFQKFTDNKVKSKEISM